MYVYTSYIPATYVYLLFIFYLFFILPIFLSIYICLLYPYAYKCIRVFGITWTMTYSKKLHSLKTSTESFWVISGLILVEFLNLLRSVKPLLIKLGKDVFCITPMLATFFRANPSLLEAIFGVFFGLYCGVFSLYLEERLVSYEILHIYC